jgi:hypothetical protein
MKFRPKPTRKIIGVGLKAPPPHLAPAAPIVVTVLGETRPRFRRDPDADTLPVNDRVVGAAARVTHAERGRPIDLDDCLAQHTPADDLPPGARPPRGPRGQGTVASILAFLAGHGASVTREICEGTGLPQSSVSTTLCYLAHTGRVGRAPEPRRHPANNRAMTVWLLPAPAGGRRGEVTAA